MPLTQLCNWLNHNPDSRCLWLSDATNAAIGSCDDKAGEAGPVEQSSTEAKSLKLRAKGLPGGHLSGQQPRQPDGEPTGKNKEQLSWQFAIKNRA